MKFSKLLSIVSVLALPTACDADLDTDDRAALQEMALTSETPVPPSPTNRFADDLAAAQLGKAIFFDRRMSRDGSTACGSCHLEDQGWSDDREVSVGVDDREGGRHSMPSHTIAFQDFFFWDGRADSAWSQTLQAIESNAEMDFPRESVADYVVEHRRADYEAIFGEIPVGFANDTDAVNRIFANVGKSLEAYQRQLICADTRFDQWATGAVTMTAEEEAGATVFMEEGCADCHGGVAFSNGLFHELGVESQFADDNGREDGLRAVLDNPFNGAGRYSDDVAYGAAKLQRALEEERTEDAFKTPSLRGVAQRGRFGHGGVHRSLEDFMQETYRGGRNRNGGRDPLLQGVNVGDDADEVIAFLEMLNCPPVAPQWRTPDDFE